MTMIPADSTEMPFAGYEIDTDKSRLDLAMIHGFLSRSHWAKGIPLDVLSRAIDNSIAFGLYREGVQIGFARVVSDHATFAYLADVFILESERRRGLGTWLVRTILAHPELQGLRRWLLGTRNAQNLYLRCGFAAPPRTYGRRSRAPGLSCGGSPRSGARMALARARARLWPARFEAGCR